MAAPFTPPHRILRFGSSPWSKNHPQELAGKQQPDDHGVVKKRREAVAPLAGKKKVKCERQVPAEHSVLRDEEDKLAPCRQSQQKVVDNPDEREDPPKLCDEQLASEQLSQLHAVVKQESEVASPAGSRAKVKHEQVPDSSLILLDEDDQPKKKMSSKRKAQQASAESSRQKKQMMVKSENDREIRPRMTVRDYKRMLQRDQQYDDLFEKSQRLVEVLQERERLKVALRAAEAIINRCSCGNH